MLTGATLRTQDSFSYLQRRVGLQECETLSLGSPFDFEKAALVLIPRDMPDPGSPDYVDALAHAVIGLARASQGRALVLFTSQAVHHGGHGCTH